MTRTHPAEGERVERDSSVRVYVSLGPRSVTLPALRDRPWSEVQQRLGENHIEITPEPLEVFSDLAEGQVVRVLITVAGIADPVNCNDGCEVLQGSTAELRVSLGPMPDVRGATVAEATSTLEERRLVVSPEPRERYDEDVAKDLVIGIADREPSGAWRPGDAVTLIVSLGPEPIKIPNVRGKTIREAYEQLTDLGFRVVTVAPEFTWSFFRVDRTDPAIGSSHIRGTEIRLIAIG